MSECTCGSLTLLHWATCPRGIEQRRLDPEIELKYNRAGKYYIKPKTFEDAMLERLDSIEGLLNKIAEQKL